MRASSSVALDTENPIQHFTLHGTITPRTLCHLPHTSANSKTIIISLSNCFHKISFSYAFTASLRALKPFTQQSPKGTINNLNYRSPTHIAFLSQIDPATYAINTESQSRLPKTTPKDNNYRLYGRLFSQSFCHFPAQTLRSSSPEAATLSAC